ncbi:ATP-grasp fold amidoligase family protein [Pareuzebyella sediminis]|uniref:ATP-grasp fold amidoligase family protein n=1 Tax=Pareuzebyella sediminis TaxID=2607998 RepID=UPI0011ED1A4D|nr:ATP-grasp fold amidoligase family protein [Pareuzebyella sediminis]
MKMLRKVLTNFYYKNSFGRLLIDPIFKVRNKVIPLKIILKKRFRRLLGYELDLQNPKTLNEKIQWLKINDRSELHVICADKFKVRSHVAKKIGEEHLIPLIKETKDINELKPSELPDYPVIIKTNHDSGGTTIIRDKKLVDWVSLREKLGKSLKRRYGDYKGEWQYAKIEPRVVIEKLMLDEHGQIPLDYKLHCMNGTVKFIQVDIDRSTNHRRNVYDSEWQQFPLRWVHENGGNIKKPEALERMIELAECLAQDFHYVRVDLYYIKKKIYFGELTFHSGSGFEKFIPEIWDYNFGKMLSLPGKNN